MDVKISVVTVCYNAVNELEQTILSVLNQDYCNIEYIVIDGGSNDGSIDIVKRYSERISFWISEKDKGIYDAMNKGIYAASGDYILFMNAGDFFFDEKTISKCIALFDYDHRIDVYYGRTLCKYDFFLAEVDPLPLETMTKMLPFCHQSAFIKTDYHKKHLFNLDYRIFADQVFFLDLYNSKGVFKQLDIIVSIYDAEKGISSKVSKLRIIESLKIQGIFNQRNYYKELYKEFMISVKTTIKRLLMPTSIYKGCIINNTLLRPNVVSVRKRVPFS